MTCRIPIPPLDPLIDEWPAGKPIYRLYRVDYASEQFNPGLDDQGNQVKSTRFAPIRNEQGKIVPYIYGGSSLDCAIFETVFHDVPIDGLYKYVDLEYFSNYCHAILAPQRVLRLVDLTTDGLHRLKVPKEELITSPSRYYKETALWAQTLHWQGPDADGLMWMSRPRDRDQSLMLFGDRVKASDLKVSTKGGALQNNTPLQQVIIELALRVGIDVE